MVVRGGKTIEASGDRFQSECAGPGAAGAFAKTWQMRVYWVENNNNGKSKKKKKKKKMGEEKCQKR